MGSRAKARYFSSDRKIPSQNSLLVTKKFDWVLCGGDDQTRTDYLYVANVSLYRVSYIPKCLIIITDIFNFFNHFQLYF